MDGLSNLLRREADAFGVIHGFQHVGDELPDLRGDGGDGLAFLAQRRMAVFDDRQDHAGRVKGQKHRTQLIRIYGLLTINPKTLCQ